MDNRFKTAEQLWSEHMRAMLERAEEPTEGEIEFVENLSAPFFGPSGKDFSFPNDFPPTISEPIRILAEHSLFKDRAVFVCPVCGTESFDTHIEGNEQGVLPIKSHCHNCGHRWVVEMEKP